MSEIIKNISKMTIKKFVATYTKDDIWHEFKKVQLAAGFDVNKLKEANSLYKLYAAYDQLKIYASFKAH